VSTCAAAGAACRIAPPTPSSATEANQPRDPSPAEPRPPGRRLPAHTQSRPLVRRSITPTKTQIRSREGALTKPNEQQPRPRSRSNCHNRERGAGINLRARGRKPALSDPTNRRTRSMYSTIGGTWDQAAAGCAVGRPGTRRRRLATSGLLVYRNPAIGCIVGRPGLAGTADWCASGGSHGLPSGVRGLRRHVGVASEGHRSTACGPGLDRRPGRSRRPGSIAGLGSASAGVCRLWRPLRPGSRERIC